MSFLTGEMVAEYWLRYIGGVIWNVTEIIPQKYGYFPEAETEIVMTYGVFNGSPEYLVANYENG